MFGSTLQTSVTTGYNSYVCKIKKDINKNHGE